MTKNNYTIEPPPEDKNVEVPFRVVHTIDVYAPNETKAAEEAWKMMHADDAQDPVLTVLDHKGNQTTIDLFDVLEFDKITSGFVVQKYRKDTDGKFQCKWQEFVAGDDVQFENSKGETIDTPAHDEQQLNMTLVSKSKIVHFIQEVLKTLNAGSEPSRQFTNAINILTQLLNDLNG